MNTLHQLILRPVVRVVSAIVAPRSDDDRGAVSTEYALLLVLIALVLIAAMITFGIAVSDMIQGGADAFP